MKKIKLFLAAMAAMVTMGAQAQIWTPQAPADGDFFLYNVGTGTFLSCGESWGTYAVVGNGALNFTLENNGTGYTLYTTSTFTYGNPNAAQLQSNGYVDQNVNPTTWTFGSVNGEENTYTMKNTAGKYLYAPSDGTINTILDAADPTNVYGYWKLINKENLFTNASETTPVDVTCLIGDANFESSNTTMMNLWTIEASNKNLSGGDSPNKCAESYQSAFTLSQTITSVPNGVYELTAQAAVTEYTVTGENMPVVYANDQTTPFVAMTNGEASLGAVSNSFKNGNYGVGPIRVVVTTGSLTIGVRGTRTNTWCAWDNFRLYYKGVDLTALREVLQELIDAVPALEGTTTTAAYNSAKDYADGLDVSALTTEAGLTDAANELENRINTAKALQTNYTRFKDVRTAVLAINSDIDVSAANTQVEEAITNAAIDAAVVTLRTALAGYLPSVVDEQIDITAALIDNPAPYINGDYWTLSTTPTNYDPRNMCAEFWNASGASLQQNLTIAMPQGYYKLTAKAFTRTGMVATLSVGNVASMSIATSNVNSLGAAKPYFDDGTFDNELTFHLEGSLSPEEFYIKLTADNKSSDYWMAWRSFKLEYLGTAPLTILQAQLEAAADAAQDYLTSISNGSLPDAMKSASSNAINDACANHSSVAECLQSMADIEAIIADVDAAVIAYAEYKAVKANVEAMMSVTGYTETISGATTTLTNAISGIDAAVEAATTSATIIEQTVALKAAGKTFIGGVRSDGEHPFDITFLITNASFDNNDATGWTANPAPGFQSYNNCEYYQKEFDIYQTLNNMPKGNYELKVQAFQRPGWFEAVYNAYQSGTNNVSSVIYINDGQTTIKNLVSEGATDATHQWANGNDSHLDGGTEYYANSMLGASKAFAAGYYWNTVLTAVEGTLKFGFKSTQTHVSGDWTIFDNFQLYYYGQSINIAMDETETFAVLADIEGANVTMARTSKVGYNTVALPFDLTATQVQTVFGEGAVVYSFSDTDENTINFTTKTEQTIEANVPVLVKATAAATEISVNNVTVKTGEAKVEGTYFDFVGNYGGQITLAEGLWFVGGSDAGKLYKSGGTTTMKGFRAYLQAKSGASSVKLYIDGEDNETSIEEINGEATEGGIIYNLAGQRISKMQKGINIVNGKKVLF